METIIKLSPDHNVVLYAENEAGDRAKITVSANLFDNFCTVLARVDIAEMGHSNLSTEQRANSQEFTVFSRTGKKADKA